MFYENNDSSYNENKTSLTTVKGRRIQNNSQNHDEGSVGSLSLCEEDGSLTIPTKGRFLQISTQEDGAQTVLDTGERQIILNGKFLSTSRYSLSFWPSVCY